MDGSSSDAQRPGRRGNPRCHRLVLTCCLACAAACAEAGPELLRSSVELRERILAVLRDLSRGDGGSLEALPDEVLLRPPGLVTTGGGLRRWTAELPRALARAEDPSRALEALDARYNRLAAELDRAALVPAARAARREGLAVHFLPVPAAVRELVRAADRAFDRGRCRRYLTIRAILHAAGVGVTDDGAARARRVVVARRLAGLDPAARPFAPCGPPRRLAEIPASPPRPLLRRLDDHLVKLDPWDRVVWQHPVLGRARIWTGSGGALVHDRSGLRLLDPAGTVRVLPATAGMTVLGVGRRAAWFLMERASRNSDPTAGRPRRFEVHRLDLEGEGRMRFVLPERPLCPPLAGGRQSLWLTATTVFLVEGSRIAHRFRHGLELGPGTAWHPDLHPQRFTDGEAWYALTPFDPAAVEHLVRADRAAAALERYAELDPPDDDARRWALRAALVRGPAAGPLAAVLPLAADPADRLRLAQRWERAGHGIADEGLRGELAALTARLPYLALPGASRDHPLDPPTTWTWQRSARSWWAGGGRRTERTPPAAVIAALRRGGWPVRPTPAPGPAPWPPALTWVDHPELGRIHGDGERLYGVTIVDSPHRHLHLTELTAYAATDGSRLWSRRWTTPDYLVSRNLALRDGHLLCAEGQARVHALDPVTGAVVGSYFTPNGKATPAALTVLTPDRLAWVGPPGLEDRLEVFDSQTRILEAHGLADGFRCMVGLGDSGLALRVRPDGGLVLEPAGTPLAGRAPNGTTPVVTAAGIWFGEEFLAWTAAADGQDLPSER